MNVIRIAALAAVVFLMGCGGGGGGGGGTASTPETNDNPTMTGDGTAMPDDGTMMADTSTDPVVPDPVVPDPVVPDPVVPDPVIPDPVVPDPPVVEVVKMDAPAPTPPTPPQQDAPDDIATTVTTTAAAVSVPTSAIPSAGTGTKTAYYMADCDPNVQGCYTDSTGTPVNVQDDAMSVYPNGVTALGKRIEGNTIGSAELTVTNPPRDVRTAWRNGWTGEGVNLLIVDGFGTPGSSTGSTHGYTVGMSALSIAPGASFYALEAGIDPATAYRRGNLRRADNTMAPSSTRIDVINMSFGTDPITPPISDEELIARLTAIDNEPLYNDVLAGDFLTNANDAVITKAAGNENADAILVLENLALVVADVTKSRVLIVGALDGYAQDGNARLGTYPNGVTYSNRAGIFPTMQERFLVEYGGSPYGENAYLCDAATLPRNGCRSLQALNPINDLTSGTSYAAPRVAGFAALVRHKFPSLSGVQTTKILLDTATYEGLACHPNCDVAIYGQGRVDIADALSPIGKLE